MIIPNEFKLKRKANLSEYEDGLVTAKKDCFLLNSLPKELKGFLTLAGLPDGAAPFLSFYNIAKGLMRIPDILGYLFRLFKK